MKKVLIVDDVLIIRNLIVNLFKNSEELAGYETLTASNAEDAYEILYKENIKILILDWMLPGDSGLDLASRLHQEGNKVPILMLTSVSERRKVQEALLLGVSDYLIKPIVKDQFIKRFLKTAQAGD